MHLHRHFTTRLHERIAVRIRPTIVKLVLPFSYWNFAGNRLLAAIDAELGNREIGTLLGNHRNESTTFGKAEGLGVAPP